LDTFNFFDLLGTLGAIFLVLAYFLSSYNNNFTNSLFYYLINILGSAFILLSLIFSNFNFSAFLIELFWILISIYGLKKKYITKNKNE